MSPRDLWARYRKLCCVCDSIGVTLDISRVKFADEFLARMAAPMSKAFAAMAALEKGAIANPDEKRMVGHYWLRAPELAPDPAIARRSARTWRRCTPSPPTCTAATFGRRRATLPEPPRHRHRRLGARAAVRRRALGIAARSRCGRSSSTTPIPTAWTATLGAHRTAELAEDADRRDLQVRRHEGDAQRHARGQRARTRRRGLELRQARGRGHRRRQRARQATRATNGWLARFPMWDWVGGRTSELSRGGPPPGRAAGARHRRRCSTARATHGRGHARARRSRKNPAALLALMWYHAGDGRGAEGHGRPPVQGPARCSSRATSSSSSWSRSARRTTSTATS